MTSAGKDVFQLQVSCVAYGNILPLTLGDRAKITFPAAVAIVAVASAVPLLLSSPY